jgi:DNA excision repair protein ERCC-2
MEDIVQKWHNSGVLAEIQSRKLLFLETKDVQETTMALDNYRRACDYGQGE